MTPDAADSALFAEALACDERRLVGFAPQTLDATSAETLLARAETTLRAISTIEDTSGDDDDLSQSPALRRMEARLDLLMALMGTLLQRGQPDTLQALRWSALGARFTVSSPVPAHTTGVMHLQAATWLPEPLELPAEVIACHPGNNTGEHLLWLRFTPINASVASALERHLFRQHRREIAERRRKA